MEAIREVYGDIDSGSNTDSNLTFKSRTNSTLTLKSVASNNDVPSTLKEVVWNLSYSFLRVQAHHKKVKRLLEVYLSSPGFPAFSMKFNEPLPQRTFLLLPGGSFLLAFSRSHEVAAWDLNQTHTNGEDIELNAICDLMDALRSQDDSEYCQNLVGVRRSRRTALQDKVFSIEISSAKICETEEALVTVSIFKNAFLQG